MAAALTGSATPNVVGNPGTGSPNRLLFTNPTGTGTPDPTPTATATATASPTACDPTFTDSLSGTGDSKYSPGCQATSTYTHRGVLSGPARCRLRSLPAEVQRLDLDERGQRARGDGVRERDLQRHAGMYRWRVYAYRGSGSFTLQIT